MTTRTPRDRMVYSTVQLVRAQGVAATGVREVIKHSGAPRGSFQHYFPGGKDQLVGEAVVWAADFAARWAAGYRQTARRPSPAGLFAHMAAWWKDEFLTYGYERGCPVLAALADTAGHDSPVNEAAGRALETWTEAVVTELVGMKVSRRRSRRLATVMLSALEGAIIMARAQHCVEPLDVVVAELRPLLTAAVGT